MTETPQSHEVTIRIATPADIPDITRIYNEGIRDRLATLETEERTPEERLAWLEARDQRHLRPDPQPNVSRLAAGLCKSRDAVSKPRGGAVDYPAVHHLRSSHCQAGGGIFGPPIWTVLRRISREGTTVGLMTHLGGTPQKPEQSVEKEER